MRKVCVEMGLKAMTSEMNHWSARKLMSPAKWIYHFWAEWYRGRGLWSMIPNRVRLASGTLKSLFAWKKQGWANCVLRQCCSLTENVWFTMNLSQNDEQRLRNRVPRFRRGICNNWILQHGNAPTRLHTRDSSPGTLLEFLWWKHSLITEITAVSWWPHWIGKPRYECMHKGHGPVSYPAYMRCHSMLPRNFIISSCV